MNKLQKFKFVLSQTVLNRQQPLVLKLVFLAIAFRQAYAISGSVAIATLIIFAVMLPLLLGIAFIIVNSSESFFASYKSAIESNRAVPNSKAVTVFVVSYVLLLIGVISYFVVRDLE